MNPMRQATPPKTMRTASVIILIFAAALLVFGLNMFRIGSSDTKLAQDLAATGLAGTVTDTRAQVGRTNDGIWHIFRGELSFTGSDGQEYVMETTNFPRFHGSSYFDDGWIDEFPTKEEIIGQDVLYRVDDRPAVLLVSEMPALLNSGWTFPNYLGLAFIVLGSGFGIGGTISLLRAIRQLKA